MAVTDLKASAPRNSSHARFRFEVEIQVLGEVHGYYGDVKREAGVLKSRSRKRTDGDDVVYGSEEWDSVVIGRI